MKNFKHLKSRENNIMGSTVLNTQACHTCFFGLNVYVPLPMKFIS